MLTVKRENHVLPLTNTFIRNLTGALDNNSDKGCKKLLTVKRENPVLPLTNTFIRNLTGAKDNKSGKVVDNAKIIPVFRITIFVISC